MLTNNSSEGSNTVVFWALNGYGVTVFDLLANSVIILSGTIIVLLNALVVDTMIRFKEPVEPADVMMRSLAIADLMTGLVMLHQASYNLVNYQVYLECLVRQGITFGLVVSAVLHLSCLTWDRYVKIMFPYRYNELCKMTTVSILSAFLWALSVLVAVAPSIGWNSRNMPDDGSLHAKESNEHQPMCSFFGHLHPDFATLLVSLFLMAFFVMGIMYLHIFKVANRHARLIEAQSHHDIVAGRKSSHSWRYTKTVLIIMGLYFLCWLPVGIVLIMFVSGHLKSKNVVEQGSIVVYATVAAYLNSLMNPIIYAFKITAVRTRFRRIFRCRPCGRLVADNNTAASRRCEASDVTYPNVGTISAHKLEIT